MVPPQDVNVNVNVRLVGVPDPKVNEILRLLRRLTRQGDEIMADLTAITAGVTEAVTVEESAIALINNLAAEIAAAGTDPAALQALTDQLNAESASLAAAVAANT